MSYEEYQQAQILDHCWSVYLLLTANLPLGEDFPAQYPALVESALISGNLQISLKITELYDLHVREEYRFFQGNLGISSYSYTLVDADNNAVFRADGLPYHNTDYKSQPLAHPPHHIHDRRGRIRSFSGNLQDFITEIKGIISHL
jgi:hypothetical protein